eukprot:CAMPEP_0196763400 /NCGR_PEP_ID=MMETSP1095-20130614/4019_1 /TAXON_ID=96789 ORGANISM="Chromulina nebulosa, Strain UTEXLB2642" /NCGR_SAMPLE_ID=MMETSP1095 /ASSEMBLY_ACC=CAM_ASM_000446 /LENGTH=530 /DNA_ID=CAMNT_0042116515 /DNA_START=275 /DNA_END=1863 /DNA_ORIENTATION=+
MKQGLKDIPSPIEYLTNNLTEGSVIGIDPWVHNAESIERSLSSFQSKGLSIKSLSFNPIDVIWSTSERPALPSDPVRLHSLEYAGLSIDDKISKIRSSFALDNQLNGIIITSLDEIAWLFNLRGSDVSCNPVFVSYALVTKDNIYLFIDNSKIPDDIRSHLTASNVNILPYDQVLNTVITEASKGKLWIDKKSINYAIYSSIPSSSRYEKESPLVLLKACKNDAELSGMRACHIRDGAAVTEFLSWLFSYLNNESDEIINKDCNLNINGDRHISEYDIDIILTNLRKEMSPQGMFLEPSFSTIAGVNSNGAIIHYRAPKDGCKLLTKDDMLLLDSGGQYKDGTTDVTRTIHLGKPSDYQMEMFTRVLKGHIAIDSRVFPSGTPGCLIDSYAREHLWAIGKDFIHGVGHGVGAALNVHEGPQRISRVLDGHALLPGMIISNEPGYYETNNFGIRIENLLIVTERSDLGEFAGRKFYGFDRLTHIPIQKSLIKTDLLTNQEIKWLNDYHTQVYDKVYPLLKTDRARIWLKEA